MPLAIRYGVPENIFWDLNPKRLEPWQRHYEYQEQLKKDDDDYRAWLSGRYILDAIAAALDGKSNPYPTEPYSTTQRRNEEEEARQIASDKFMAFAMAFNARFEAQQNS